MVSKAVQDAINEQIKHELFSAYVYLSMSGYCESRSLPGLARWLRSQGQEELGHAMKLYDHLIERGARVSLQPIDRPPAEFDSPLQLFEQALAHEQGVTQMIHKLYEVAVKEKDYPAQVMLQWFITEQVEEEQNAGQVVDALRLVGEDGPALLMLDRELGARGSAG